MEAAASFGFKHVSPAVLDACLAQIRCKPGRTGAKRAGALIDAYKAQWGWSKVDCARALMHVLPGQNQAKRKEPSHMTDNSPIWEDLPSLVQALQAHQVSQAQSMQEQPDPGARAEDVDPLVQAIVAIEGAPLLYFHPNPNYRTT